ncbi:double-strand break repair helicase AddA [Primorskyibacter sp. S187A]|uniref:double-strand break repair helicase AddA n=1 Tax=Primorskyibacter sp. S187A TaxID=3415130 RepID=UPI003C7C8656
MTGRDEATSAQVRAARPDASTWLAANAGSGKTRVLTDRVARLLLDGVPPEHILCLTYTKAAASEMQNRLFQRLGEWAMLEDVSLRSALGELGLTSTIDADTLANARSLFARAIETPGGLKIQTIHAFCSSILRRFPLEAGVSPQFQEMEDRSGQLLRARILQDMADGPEVDLVHRLAQHLSDADFDTITSAVSRAREHFEEPLSEAALYEAFGVPEGASDTWVWQDALGPSDRALIGRLAEEAEQQSATMVTMAQSLRVALKAPDDASCAAHLAKELLTKAGTPNQKKPTKKTWEAMGGEKLALRALIDRLSDAFDRPRRLAALERTRDLHAFAQAFLPRFAEAKTLRGWLDFDDLILKTRDLLSNDEVAPWVLFRLDGGIDHILVDEAQDTSPVQWDVIDRLAQEFTSGLGARDDVNRTIFVVGDKKQSIYSFQGADPTGFDRMRERFRDKLRSIEAVFQDAVLEYSFRSAEAILSLVDCTFENREASGFPKGARHRAFKAEMPGRVDLWPVVAPTEKPAERVWTDTVDRVDDTHETVRLAQHVAHQIGEMLSGNHVLPVFDEDAKQWRGRRIEPRDVLILVQRRSGLFEEIIRACKNAELPIAGADRLKVGAELAVRDLAALLSWLALPEDDLSLATALKSPLFGWSEQDLFTLAHGRDKQFLWRVLEARKETHAETWAMLQDLRDAADFLRPYDLIERILIRHKGRSRLLARLGPEAEDGINALLEQSIAYESSETPSLTGFLIWLETDDLEIKRQPDAASNQIRVMTVHGAKGLEAPIVILPDCGARQNSVKDDILTEPGTAVWKTNADAMPQPMTPWIDAVKQRQAEERDRLLYVAMTRAENWLIVAAAGKLEGEPEPWHTTVARAMDMQGAAEHGFEGLGGGLRLTNGAWPEAAVEAASAVDRTPLAPPDWITQTAPEPNVPLPVLSPSNLGGAKALAGQDGMDEEAALAHGTAVHQWLERLAEGRAIPSMDAIPEVAKHEAQRVFSDPALAHLFAPGTLGEVSLSADVPELGRRLHGIIDRLVISEKDVIAVDFKTNATVPADVEQTPEGLLRQMGAYAHMLAEIYPDRQIRTALLWTRTASLMELPHDLVTQALMRTT